MAKSEPDDFGTLFPQPDSKGGAVGQKGLAGVAGGRLPLAGEGAARATPTRGGASGATPGPADFKTQVAGDKLDPKALKETLVGRSIVTAADWDAAAAAVRSDKDVLNIVHQLGRMKASWQVGDEERFNALTQFQIQQILNNYADRLRLQHYVILDRIGGGGMGEVFRARNVNLPRIEAVKTMLPESVGGPEIDSSQGKERFEQESRVLAQLNHRYITTIHHAGQDHGVAFIAMEYVHGQDMKSIVEESNAAGEKVPVWWAAERTMAVAEALGHAHDNGVIHRDVKPTNIMITEENEVKVLDMGIARLFNKDGGSRTASPLTQSATGLGTPEVMSPEQWADASAVTPASDIYSLGCTFYYILAGRMPFEAETISGLMYAHVNDPPPPLNRFRKDVPKGLDALLAKMLAKDPNDRFSRCEEVVEALLPFTDPNLGSGGGGGGVGIGTLLKWASLATAAAVLGVAITYFGREFLKPDFEAQAREWLASHQSANAEIWTDVQSLESAVRRQVPKVASPGDLESFKQKADEETKTRRGVGSSVDDWLTAHQKANAAIWQDLASLRAFAGQKQSLPLYDNDAFGRLQKDVNDETDRRKRLHEKVDAFLAEHQKEHPTEWKDLAEIKQAATAKAAMASIANDRDLEEFKRRIGALTDARMKDSFPITVRKRLDEYFGANRETWKTQDAVDKFVADKLMPLDQIKDLPTLTRAIKALDEETWQQKTEEWVEPFGKSNEIAWNSSNELRSFVDSLPKPLDQPSFEKFKDSVLSETKKRIQKKVTDELAAIQRDNPEAWRSVDELQEAVKKADSLTIESITGAEQYNRFLLRAKDVTVRQHFELAAKSLQFAGVEKVQKDYTGRLLVYLCEWLLRLDPNKLDANADLALHSTVDGKEVKVIPTGKDFDLSVSSRRGGYLTFIALGSSGAHFIYQWRQPMMPGKAMLISIPGIQTEGVDTILMFLTDIDPLADAPVRPTNVPFFGKAETGGELDGMTYLELESNEVGMVKNAFKKRGFFDQVIEHLDSGRPFPGISSGALDGQERHWARAKATLTIKKP